MKRYWKKLGYSYTYTYATWPMAKHVNISQFMFGMLGSRHLCRFSFRVDRSRYLPLSLWFQHFIILSQLNNNKENGIGAGAIFFYALVKMPMMINRCVNENSFLSHSAMNLFLRQFLFFFCLVSVFFLPKHFINIFLLIRRTSETIAIVRERKGTFSSSVKATWVLNAIVKQTAIERRHPGRNIHIALFICAQIFL